MKTITAIMLAISSLVVPEQSLAAENNQAKKIQKESLEFRKS